MPPLLREGDCWTIWWCLRPGNLFISSHRQLKAQFFLVSSPPLTFKRETSSAPDFIEYINNPFSISLCLSNQSQCLRYFHQLSASSTIWSPLSCTQATRKECRNSQLLFPVSICLSCSQITLGFLQHTCTEGSQPPCNHASCLCTLPSNQDHRRAKVGRDLKPGVTFRGKHIAFQCMNSLSAQIIKQSKTEISLYYFLYCSLIFYYYIVLSAYNFSDSFCNIFNVCKVLWNKYKYKNWIILWIWPVLDIWTFPTQINISFPISLLKITNYSLKMM